MSGGPVKKAYTAVKMTSSTIWHNMPRQRWQDKCHTNDFPPWHKQTLPAFDPAMHNLALPSGRSRMEDAKTETADWAVSV
mmetsp:Transcript_88844/g.154109  ORF Transcript_88844/g.154109 Transcript_88844/m.154109 type:complete len:80 (+) Transcript_88844:1552-1791(+)